MLTLLSVLNDLWQIQRNYVMATDALGCFLVQRVKDHLFLMYVEFILKKIKALKHSKMQMENGQHSIHELVEA